ncbi:hypothetical protein FE391_06115 [Nonomuraea sp. KC401]|uniref:hypothetical protein n=1 Tax=unclassified Nonomuraea TaxID=2593643 RepID=UPI0010FE6F09|nr:MULTISPECIES: hypothetical protein [unclassified Nonomuraea]NBE92328.1 hypothetical protein [Nonomuraea sp. K271]TLF81866.1 hypothetical protein FE391_06115 [Nonomuraea sp. KC401]
MARIIERKAKNGATSWLVKWRIGGGRSSKEDSETCYERQIAEDFAALVELSGENRPHGYPKGCHGIRDPHFDGIIDADMPTFAQYARHNYATRARRRPHPAPGLSGRGGATRFSILRAPAIGSGHSSCAAGMGGMDAHQTIRTQRAPAEPAPFG